MVKKKVSPIEEMEKMVTAAKTKTKYCSFSQSRICNSSYRAYVEAPKHVPGCEMEHVDNMEPDCRRMRSEFIAYAISEGLESIAMALNPPECGCPECEEKREKAASVADTRAYC